MSDDLPFDFIAPSNFLYKLPLLPPYLEALKTTDETTQPQSSISLYNKSSMKCVSYAFAYNTRPEERVPRVLREDSEVRQRQAAEYLIAFGLDGKSLLQPPVPEFVPSPRSTYRFLYHGAIRDRRDAYVLLSAVYRAKHSNVAVFTLEEHEALDFITPGSIFLVSTTDKFTDFRNWNLISASEGVFEYQEVSSVPEPDTLRRNVITFHPVAYPLQNYFIIAYTTRRHFIEQSLPIVDDDEQLRGCDC